MTNENHELYFMTITNVLIGVRCYSDYTYMAIVI